ncbi:toxin glutamine deamidase domain-containing protein [Actinomadura rudentiformis]|uniref:Tox-PL domain-containing protein n=1 Tax=Actinomadura rudentiformis TaxID=359158 RepID=A0A6H9YGD2_9ACTN|nr:toxin glutamine deamidase domain-containing protein [Actinomadura rudentiformis]KAB2343938.1 hypothetical protein F8566_31805 [Actinomadura rudentiformis]
MPEAGGWTVSRAEQAAAQLQRVKQLAEDHGPAMRQAFAVLLEGALIGPAGERLLNALAERHRDARSDFYGAFDAVKNLAAEAEGGPPRIGEPYIPGPPRGGLRTGDVRSGSPDALHRLSVELDRAGRTWQEAGQALSNILGGLDLSTAPAQNIVRAGGWVAGQRHDIIRRRDELLRADQQQLLQATYNTVRGLGQALGQSDSNPLNKAWNDYAHRYLPGLWEGTKDIGLTGLASNPFTAPAYAMANPRSWMQRGPIGQFKGLIQGAQHPVAFAKAMINWDLWKRDPVRAYGQVVPSIVIGALTLGTGSSSGAASRLSTALRQTGKTKPDTPEVTTGGAVRALDEAADQAGKTDPLGKQNTRTPTPDSPISPKREDPGMPSQPAPAPKPLYQNPKVTRHSGTAGQKEFDYKFPELKNINPQFSTGKWEFQNNCQSCVVNVDRRLAGESPSSAVPQNPKYPFDWPRSVTDNAGPGGSFQQVNDYDEIINELLKAGDGARGVVHGGRLDPKTGIYMSGHVFNVVNRGGKIHFIDGQTGTWALLEKFGHLEFYRTK